RFLSHRRCLNGTLGIAPSISQGGSVMSDSISRRSFTTYSAAFVLASTAEPAVADDKVKAPPHPRAADARPASGPVEAPFERDYSPPGFKPSWKKPQLHRLLVQDFVIY